MAKLPGEIRRTFPVAHYWLGSGISLPDVSQWLRKECFGKETREPCTVSRHTVCTHKSNRALQRALGTLRATCKPHCLHQENLLPQPKQPGAQTVTQKQPYTAYALLQAQGQRFPSTRRRDDAAPPLPNGGAGPTCLQTV